MMKSLVFYDSQGGNTEKVSACIQKTLEGLQIGCDRVKVQPDLDVDFLTYDLIFPGSPVINWLPTEKMITFVKSRFRAYGKDGIVVPAAPYRDGKFAVCFCTYSGTHIGKAEAVPATKWFAAFAGHLGFLVLDEWHVVGQFHNREELNTKGRLGDIRGRPSEQDLKAAERSPFFDAPQLFLVECVIYRAADPRLGFEE